MKGCISKKLVSLVLSLALCTTAVPMVSLSSSAAGTVTPKVAAGNSHTVLLKADGSVWATGKNDKGQLGIGEESTKVPKTATFTQCVDSTGEKIKNATDIACGGDHTAVIRGDGELWACGYNVFGQLGTGDRGSKPQFEKSKEDASGNYIIDAIAVACGENHTAVIRAGGRLMTSGNNISGQLGMGGTKPICTTGFVPCKDVDSNEITDATAVACGSTNTAVIRGDGRLFQCGSNTNGILGVKSSEYKPGFFGQTVDYNDDEITDATAVACGEDHTAVIRGDGELWACGQDGNGQLGRGFESTLSSKFAECKAECKDVDHKEKITDATAVACGKNHTAVIRADGQLLQCGENDSGQLSAEIESNSTPSFTPSKDANGEITNVVAVSIFCKSNSTVILRSDANGNLELLGTGANTYGQLGLGENDEIDDKCQDQTTFVSSMILDIGKAPTSSSVETITKKGPSNPHEVTGTGEFVGVTNVTIAWGNLTYDYNAKWDPNKKEWVQNGDKEFWTASSTDADKITATNNSSEDYNVALSFTVDSDYDAGEKGEAVEGSFVRKTSSGKEEAVTGNTLNLTTASKEDTVYLKLSGMSDKITGVEDLQNQTFGVVTATLSKN